MDSLVWLLWFKHLGCCSTFEKRKLLAQRPMFFYALLKSRNVPRVWITIMNKNSSLGRVMESGHHHVRTSNSLYERYAIIHLAIALTQEIAWNVKYHRDNVETLIFHNHSEQAVSENVLMAFENFLHRIVFMSITFSYLTERFLRQSVQMNVWHPANFVHNVSFVFLL